MLELQQVQLHLGQQFVVENVGGAGGTTGTTRAARATPDGTTLISGHLGTNALAAVFYPNLAYDPEKDFEPVGLIAEQPELLAVRKDFPANNLKEFVAYAKANESKLNMAHAGVGSVSYIGCLLLNAAIGIKPTHGAVHRHRAGDERDPRRPGRLRLRSGARPAAACAAPAPPRRSPSPPRNAARCCPNVPTSSEQGMPEFDCAPFYAVFAPKGTPKAIVDKLAEALEQGPRRGAGAQAAGKPRRRPSPRRTGAVRRRWASSCTARSRG